MNAECARADEAEREGDCNLGRHNLEAHVASLSDEIERLRQALNIAVSRGCDHCAESIKQARAALESRSG
jgi:hypothetical protein